MIDTRRSALLIINPNSRRGSQIDIQEGMDLLKASGIDLIYKKSASAVETAQLINTYHENVELVIIGGGDGTVSSAAAAIYRHQLPFAILPMGTANDLARSLAIPDNILDAFQLIANNRRRRIDLAVVNDRYFFNAANIGLGVRVTKGLTPETKRRLGVLSYLKAVFAAFKSNRKFRVDIRVDGKRYRLHSIQLAVGNGRYYGGGNVIDENATIYEGLLSLYSLKPQSMWKLIVNAPLLRNGRHSYAKRVFSASGRHIEVSTSPIREVHADGEPVGKTPVTFKVIPQALEAIVPG